MMCLSKGIQKGATDQTVATMGSIREGAGGARSRRVTPWVWWWSGALNWAAQCQQKSRLSRPCSGSCRPSLPGCDARPADGIMYGP